MMKSSPVAPFHVLDSVGRQRGKQMSGRSIELVQDPCPQYMYLGTWRAKTIISQNPEIHSPQLSRLRVHKSQQDPTDYERKTRDLSSSLQASMRHRGTFPVAWSKASSTMPPPQMKRSILPLEEMIPVDEVLYVFVQITVSTLD